jgi:uncharacterized DUF497 family protein
MEIEYDINKSSKNIKERELSFELARDFNLDTAFTWQDFRYDYDGETRFISIGYIGSRLYNLVFTPRGEILRVISLRKANSREVKKYAKYINS